MGENYQHKASSTNTISKNMLWA